MGRTNPTYRDLVRALEDRWSGYRRVLRRTNQQRFDRFFRYARDHADAASELNHESPVVPLLVSICLAQEQRIDELEERVSEPVGEQIDAESTASEDGGGDGD
jgi:hypothetical protein